LNIRDINAKLTTTTTATTKRAEKKGKAENRFIFTLHIIYFVRHIKNQKIKKKKENINQPAAQKKYIASTTTNICSSNNNSNNISNNNHNCLHFAFCARTEKKRRIFIVYGHNI